MGSFTGDSKKMWYILHDKTDKFNREDILPDLINKETANKFNDFFRKCRMNVQKKLNVNIEKPIQAFVANSTFNQKPICKLKN